MKDNFGFGIADLGYEMWDVRFRNILASAGLLS